MEIFVRLSGVELGPYSEEQVREHLSEGLLSLNDLAKLDGRGEWAPLRDILGAEPKSDEVNADKPSVPPTAPAPKSTPELPPESAPGSRMVLPRRAPATPPGVTHLPNRQQESSDDDAPSDSGPVAHKTILIEPTAPIRAPHIGPAGAPIATTSPLSSANQATKKVSRTALVKAITAQTSPLPTKAINAPPRSPAPAAGTEPPVGKDAKKGGLSDLVKALSAKTVPIRPTPPVTSMPPVAPTSAREQKEEPAKPRSGLTSVPIQTTEPMPTRHIFKPGSGIMPPSNSVRSPAPVEEPSTPRPGLSSVPIQTTEPMPTRHIAKPVSGSVPPISPARTPVDKAVESAPVELSPVPIQTTEPLPTRHIFTPAPETAPSKREEPPAKPAQMPPLPPDEDYEVPTIKLPPPVAGPGEKPAAPISEKSVPPVSEKPAAPPTAPSTPRRPARLLPMLIVATAALAAFSLFYVWSPYHAATALKSALETGDATGLDAAVDFPSVRDALKAQIDEMIGQAGLQDAKAPSGTKVPTTAVRDVLDNSVDAYVSAQGISALVNKTDMSSRGDQVISPDAAAKLFLALNTQPVDNAGLASVGDFVVDRGTAKFHLQYNGLGWKLKRVELHPDFAVPGPSGAAAPIVSPVVDAYLDQGRGKARVGDTAGAIDDFTQALAIDPKSSNAYSNRGAALQAQNDSDEAISDYSAALAIDPELAPAYNGRGNARTAKGDLDGAISDYSQAIHFDPMLAVAFNGRGNARLVKGDAAGAITDFSQALSIDPNMAVAYSDRGQAREANGNSDGAIADYTQALALNPKSARTYFNRGVALQAQGNVDAAILDFDHSITFDPKDADAYYNRGNAKSSTRDIDGAIADYTQAVALNPKNGSAFANRGLVRQAKGDLDGALADYTQALSLDPKIASAYFNRAVIEAQKNDLDDAIADSTQAIYIDPTNAQAFTTRGFAKLAKGNLDGALTDLKQFTDLAPRDHNTDHVRLYLWLISKAQNGGADADQDLSSALESTWNSAPADQSTKTASFLLGRMNEPDYLATAASPDAAVDQSQHCQAWYFTGMKRLLLGDKKGAIDAFKQCVATQQKDFSEYALAQAELLALQPAPVPMVSPAPVAGEVKPPKKP